MPRADAYPEAIEYRDTGCALHRACLRCPLPRCRYEVQGGAARMLRPERNAAIVRAYLAGEAINDVAERFGLGRRQIFRITRAGR